MEDARLTERNLLNPKKHIQVTGILIDILKLGIPAYYLYNGNLIRTSKVKKILETTQDYVRFETTNSFYTIAYEKLPDELCTAA